MNIQDFIEDNSIIKIDDTVIENRYSIALFDEQGNELTCKKYKRQLIYFKSGRQAFINKNTLTFKFDIKKSITITAYGLFEYDKHMLMHDKFSYRSEISQGDRFKIMENNFTINLD